MAYGDFIWRPSIAQCIAPGSNVYKFLYEGKHNIKYINNLQGNMSLRWLRCGQTSGKTREYETHLPGLVRPSRLQYPEVTTVAVPRASSVLTHLVLLENKNQRIKWVKETEGACTGGKATETGLEAD